MKNNVKLTNRDIEFLEILGEYGAIYICDVKEKIYTSERYYRTRLSKLEENSFIIRYGKRLVYLGISGIRFLNERGIKPKSINSKIEYKKKLADIYRMSNYLNNFKIETSAEVREKRYDTLATKKYRFYARAIASRKNEYWVYKISKIKNLNNKQAAIKGKQLDIANIKKDIEDRINENENNTNVIVLCEDEESLRLYKEDNTRLSLNKEIPILYTEENINYINNVVAPALNMNDTIKILLEREGYDVKEKQNSSSVDFSLMKNGMEYNTFNLTDMNLQKEKALTNSIDFIGDLNRVALVCYREKEDYYNEMFNGIKIIGLDRPIGIASW